VIFANVTDANYSDPQFLHRKRRLEWSADMQQTGSEPQP
jgi:hypothetical protein